MIDVLVHIVNGRRFVSLLEALKLVFLAMVTFSETVPGQQDFLLILGLLSIIHVFVAVLVVFLVVFFTTTAVGVAYCLLLS